MKLYDCKVAPNPRRVNVFLAEKGIEIEKEQVDLMQGGQFDPAYQAINPRCVVPSLVLDDGTVIGEAAAICRYLEELHPEPSLYGRTPLERARIAMWEQRTLNDGIGAIGEAFRNRASAFKDRALPGPKKYAQIEALIERGRERALQFWEEVDGELAKHEFVAGGSFSVADINLLVMIDFAKWIKLEVPENLANLRRWYAAVSARPSAQG